MAELEVSDNETPENPETVVVAVGSPDGEAIGRVLRERGLVVVDCAVPLLGAQLAGDLPAMLIVDVDVPGAVAAIEPLLGSSSIRDLICVGDLSRADELGAKHAEGRAFERPLDLDALLSAVLALTSEPERAVPSLRETLPPRGFREESSPPRAIEELSLDQVLPVLPGGESVQGLPRAEVSPELSALLAAAAERVRALGKDQPASSRTPEEEIDLLLPPELLAALDEPLDPEDEAEEAEGITGAGTGHDESDGEFDSGDDDMSGGGTGAPEGTGERGGRTTGAASADVVAPSVVPQVAIPSPIAPRPTQSGMTGAGLATPLVPSPLTGVSGSSSAAISWVPKASSAPMHSDSVVTRAPTPVPPWPRPSVGPGSEPRGTSPELRGATPSDRVSPVPVAPLAEPRVIISPQIIPAEPPSGLPPLVTEGDAVRTLARLVAERATGALALGPPSATRRIVLREGDIVTAASDSPDETLVAFLIGRGDVERDVATQLTGRLPPFGRHAGAALIAHGHLGQDDLWPVLRAHAEWIIARALLTDQGVAELDPEPPGRLKAEPNVFGGATGAEVVVEAVRRVIAPEIARKRLGGSRAVIADGPRFQLLAECALPAPEEAIMRGASGRTVGEVLDAGEPELAAVLYALRALSVVDVMATVSHSDAAPKGVDPLDAEVVRKRVRARVALVEDGDYFALLGVSRGATSYEIKRAYLDLRRSFEPHRVLTAATADLSDDLRLVVEVLDEAYEILRDPNRRERYRRALEAGPP